MKNINLNLTQVPRLQGLRVYEILEFVRTQIGIYEYLSVFKIVEIIRQIMALKCL